MGQILLIAPFYSMGVNEVTNIFLMVRHTFFTWELNRQGNLKSEFLSYPHFTFKFPADRQQ